MYIEMLRRPYDRYKNVKKDRRKKHCLHRRTFKGKVEPIPGLMALVVTHDEHGHLKLTYVQMWEVLSFLSSQLGVSTLLLIFRQWKDLLSAAGLVLVSLPQAKLGQRNQHRCHVFCSFEALLRKMPVRQGSVHGTASQSCSHYMNPFCLHFQA